MAENDRRLRADAERSIRSILEAAERILRVDPSATMEQIAAAAGVARTTIHRHFANRDALVASMVNAAWRQLRDAVEQARPTMAPPLVALHQATANILRIKSGWLFALAQPAVETSTAEIQAEVFAACDAVLARARQRGDIAPDADLAWTRQVYLALLTDTAQHMAGTETDPDTLAARIIDTLLYGAVGRPKRTDR